MQHGASDTQHPVDPMRNAIDVQDTAGPMSNVIDGQDTQSQVSSDSGSSSGDVLSPPAVRRRVLDAEDDAVTMPQLSGRAWMAISSEWHTNGRIGHTEMKGFAKWTEKSKLAKAPADHLYTYKCNWCRRKLDVLLGSETDASKYRIFCAPCRSVVARMANSDQLLPCFRVEHVDRNLHMRLDPASIPSAR